MLNSLGNLTNPSSQQGAADGAIPRLDAHGKIGSGVLVRRKKRSLAHLQWEIEPQGNPRVTPAVKGTTCQ